VNESGLAVSDEELVQETKTGSRHSFEELVERYTPRLFHFLQPKIASDQDIEDIIQETFFKIYKNISRYNPKWKVSTWIYTTAYRLAVSHFRSHKKREDRKMPENKVLTPEEKFIDQKKHQLIWRKAKKLKPSQYRAFWLRYAEGMSSKEIAKVMRRTDLAARLLLYRARANLTELVQEDLSLSNESQCSDSGSLNINYGENKG
jgi:RNA polymerase sigma-70 factor (ECF subfamily)